MLRRDVSGRGESRDRLVERWGARDDQMRAASGSAVVDRGGGRAPGGCPDQAAAGEARGYAKRPSTLQDSLAASWSGQTVKHYRGSSIPYATDFFCPVCEDLIWTIHSAPAGLDDVLVLEEATRTHLEIWHPFRLKLYTRFGWRWAVKGLL